MASRIDPHTILGLEPGASRETIESAWRQAARETHPDRAGGDAERFRLARWAYEALIDPCACDDPSCKRGGHAPPPRDALRRGEDRRRVLTVSAGLALAGGVALDPIGRRVRVPPDTGVGDEIRLIGLGGPGHPPGDLILTVDVTVAPPWHRHGLDLVGPLYLTWLELYRGRAVQVFVAGRTATIPVGPRTEPLAVFELAGLGLRSGEERGSMRLVATPVAPDPGDPTLESVLLRMQLGAGEDMRSETFDLLTTPTT